MLRIPLAARFPALQLYSEIIDHQVDRAGIDDFMDITRFDDHHCTHRKNIGNKLGIKSVSGLTVYAIVNNIISIEDIQK